MKEVPFRVMCIKADARNAVTKVPSPAILKVLSEYDVIGIMTMTEGPFYLLAGIPGFSFAARLFATLPDPSEEVAIEAEHESLIYQR